MKKLLCLILILVLLLATGCNQSPPAPTQSSTETEEFTIPPLKSVGDEVIYAGNLYSIERRDGKCYIKVNDDVVLLTNEELLGRPKKSEAKSGETDNLHGLEIIYYPEIKFDSMENLVYKITRLGLNLEDLSALFNIRDNAREFEMIDLTQAFVPVMPSGYKAEGDLWYGNTYTYQAKFYKDDASSVNYDFYLKDIYFMEMESSKNQFPKNYTKQKLDDGYATEKWITPGGYTSCILYKLSKHGLSYTIYEHYSTKNSLDIPSKIVVYCNNEDVFFKVTFELGAIRPDIDWITEFYAIPYES